MTTAQIALVVPSIREDSFRRFVQEWADVGLFREISCLVLVEDNPKKTFDLKKMLGKSAPHYVEHFCWEDIDAILREKSWIIPRRSDTVRSFGYWWAWQDECKRPHSAGPSFDYIATMDDDCYPASGYEDWANLHASMLEDRTRWFNTLNNVRPRGFPYKNVGKREVMLNHGIWQGVLDYDAPQQLVNPIPETYSHDNRIVPHGAYFPMCGMNLMWQREATVLMYHLLMGQHLEAGILEKLPFDRFGDIWCGILMKKVADHMGWAVSSGTPYILHDRASDPFKNLRKEANGIEVNEWFWEKVDKIQLVSPEPGDCYYELGNAISVWDGEHHSYWKQLGSAMKTWAGLFREE